MRRNNNISTSVARFFRMNYETQIKAWLSADKMRLHALGLAAELNLNDWCLTAGFVRNMVWDRLHGYESATLLNDIDLIYFEPNDRSEAMDIMYERRLKSKSTYPWSVKNQALMNLRNHDAPYTSTCDAMSYWVEEETAVGARLAPDGEIEIIAPFGCKSLFALTVTMNRKRRKPTEFEARVNNKQWLVNWPRLTVISK